MKIRIIKCIGRTVMVLCLFIGTFLLLKSGIVSANLLVAILLAGKIISLAFLLQDSRMAGIIRNIIVTVKTENT